MTRTALCVEYDGTRYSGWQRQRHTDKTIQARVEQAASKVAVEPISVICAGRTDAGVHALGQVIHFDTAKVRKNHEWVFGINAHLPSDIRIQWATEVPGHFHARFSAAARYYRYEILNRCVKSAIHRDHVTTVFKPLQVEPMQQAAKLLIGQHDFSAFRAQGCHAKSPVKTMHNFTVKRADDLIYVDVIASAFLHHMVRNLVGVLLAVGHQEQQPEWAREVLELKDRRLAGVTAPPNGLYLRGIYYPAEFGLPTDPAFAQLANQIEQCKPISH